jgi:hypothetical protein
LISIQDGVNAYLQQLTLKCSVCPRKPKINQIDLKFFAPKLLIINCSQNTISSTTIMDESITIDGKTLHLFAIIYFGRSHFNCRFWRQNSTKTSKKYYFYDGMHDVKFQEISSNIQYFPAVINGTSASYCVYVCEGDIWIDNEQCLPTPSEIMVDLTKGSLEINADSSICLKGFKWNRNSCAFDSLMVILVQFYFEFGYYSRNSEDYRSNLGALGSFLNKNIPSESKFNMNDMKKLHKKLLEIGLFIIIYFIVHLFYVSLLYYRENV